MKIRGQDIIIGIMGLIIFSLVIKYAVQNKEVDEEGIYILGKKTEVITGGDAFPFWKYEYSVDGTIYVHGFQDIGTKFMYSDSMLFLRISSKNPKICRQVTEHRVPSCLTLKDVPNNGWKQLPLQFCDSIAVKP